MFKCSGDLKTPREKTWVVKKESCIHAFDTAMKLGIVPL